LSPHHHIPYNIATFFGPTAKALIQCRMSDISCINCKSVARQILNIYT